MQIGASVPARRVSGTTRSQCSRSSLQDRRSLPQIGNEAFDFAIPILCTHTQDRRWMNRGDDARSEFRLEAVTAGFTDAKIGAEQRLSRGCSKTYDHRRLDAGNFFFEPGPARPDFHGVGFSMKAPFAARHPFEMFHNVCDVSLAAIDLGPGEALIQQAASRADKRAPRQILLVAWRLANEHQPRVSGPFAENRLGRALE